MPDIADVIAAGLFYVSGLQKLALQTRQSPAVNNPRGLPGQRLTEQSQPSSSIEGRPAPTSRWYQSQIPWLRNGSTFQFNTLTWVVTVDGHNVGVICDLDNGRQYHEVRELPGSRYYAPYVINVVQAPVSGDTRYYVGQYIDQDDFRYIRFGTRVVIAAEYNQNVDVPLESIYTWVSNAEWENFNGRECNLSGEVLRIVSL